MKKLFILLLLISVSAMGQIKTVSSIESFSFKAREVSTINGKKRVKEYNVQAILPDKIRKEVTYPKNNEGEVYIYKGTTKIVYLPLFEQTYTEEMTTEENYIIKVIKDIKEQEQVSPKFKEEFYAGEVTEIAYTNGLKIKFDKLERVNGYYFPINISVYENEGLIAEVALQDVSINITPPESAFEIE